MRQPSTLFKPRLSRLSVNAANQNLHCGGCFMSVSTQILWAVSLVSLALWLSITSSQWEALAREWRVRVEREKDLFLPCFLHASVLYVAVYSFFLSSSCQEIFLPSLQFSLGSGNTISSSFPFRPEVVRLLNTAHLWNTQQPLWIPLIMPTPI